MTPVISKAARRSTCIHWFTSFVCGIERITMSAWMHFTNRTNWSCDYMRVNMIRAYSLTGNVNMQILYYGWGGYFIFITNNHETWLFYTCETNVRLNGQLCIRNKAINASPWMCDWHMEFHHSIFGLSIDISSLMYMYAVKLSILYTKESKWTYGKSIMCPLTTKAWEFM